MRSGFIPGILAGSDRATWIGSLFKGTMDDVAVFPFALTDDDIARAARSGVVKGPLLTVSPSGKVATAWAAIKEQ